jgi:pSer/pThr/pTyr-binding forkhead associated (FHA) protein
LQGVLVGLEGPLAGQTVPLKAGETTLGRVGGCDVVLPLPTVSSRHAKVAFADNAYHLIDLQSANGTFVNGQRVANQPLCSGDVIAVGGARFRFERR